MSYKEDHTINIDTVENVIKFSRKSERGTCEHKNIQISAEEDEVLCTDCNVRLNPVWWIQKYLKHINSFMCKHCHEVNLIDFKKLPSKAAITRGMSVVEQDHAGMTVEIER